MNIVLFGGAFNPPHIGHLIIIQQALELVDADELWLLPCYTHTFNKELASPSNRLEMLQLLTQELPENIKSKVKICPIEIDFQLSGETYLAMQKLKTEKEYLEKKGLLDPKYSIQNTKYSFLMGSDNLEKFNKWGHWQQLIKDMHFYVYPRNGHKTTNLYSNMTLLKSDTQVVTNFSSTIMRKRVQDGLTLKNFIPDSILDYLNKNSLY